jgi:hypothetical protein
VWINQAGNLPGQHAGHLRISELIDKTHALPPTSPDHACVRVWSTHAGTHDREGTR